MSYETFVTLLLICTVLTALFTEGFKKFFSFLEVSIPSNLLAGIVAVAVAVIVGTGYAVMIDMIITDKTMVYLIALVLLSWLSAMVGYDKVVQAIAQFKRDVGGE